VQQRIRAHGAAGGGEGEDGHAAPNQRVVAAEVVVDVEAGDEPGDALARRGVSSKSATVSRRAVVRSSPRMRAVCAVGVHHPPLPLPSFVASPRDPSTDNNTGISLPPVAVGAELEPAIPPHGSGLKQAPRCGCTLKWERESQAADQSPDRRRTRLLGDEPQIAAVGLEPTTRGL
jgi:hypothetical protein